MQRLLDWFESLPDSQQVVLMWVICGITTVISGVMWFVVLSEGGM